MPNRIHRRTAFTALLSAAAGGTLFALNTRERAPQFRATTLDGEKLDNETLKGKFVLLQFWATWCQYCRRDQPAVDAIVHDFPDKLVVLAVNVGESKKKVRQYLEESPRACKIVLTENTNLAAIYAAKSYPLYVVIDKDGNVAGTQNGAGGESHLRQLLKKAGLTAGGD